VHYAFVDEVRRGAVATF